MNMRIETGNVHNEVSIETIIAQAQQELDAAAKNYYLVKEKCRADIGSCTKLDQETLEADRNLLRKYNIEPDPATEDIYVEEREAKREWSNLLWKYDDNQNLVIEKVNDNETGKEWFIVRSLNEEETRLKNRTFEEMIEDSERENVELDNGKDENSKPRSIFNAVKGGLDKTDENNSKYNPVLKIVREDQ